MSAEYKSKAGFTLSVPVSARSIATIETGAQDIRVAVQMQDGTFVSQTLTLEPGSSETASFSFDKAPGGVRILLGPATTAAEDLVKFQTLTVDVAGQRMRGSELTIAPVVVSSYFWWWWHRWCRAFVIRGKVVCADGSPVPGATVTAFDVDWLFWWSSKQAIASATTDIDGAFEIDFTWCCGLWPWWWWISRVWEINPYLVEQVQSVVERDPRLKLGRTTRQPSLSAFSDILATGRGAAAPSAPLSPRETGQLEQVRGTLLEKLPASTELASLRVWPWVSWVPWWDCSPDVIFTVTQDCHAPGTVILDETVAQTRYDIAQSTDVILTAGDQACCRPLICEDQPCPEGHCIDIAQICGTRIDAIGGNAGTAGHVGYLSPGPVLAGDDGTHAHRPYAGGVSVDNANFMLGVDYYAIEHRAVGVPAAAWSPLPAGAAGDFYRGWLAPPPAPGDPWQSGNVLFAFTDRTVPGPVSSTVNVVESREHWEATTGLPTGGFWVSNWFHVVTLDSSRIGSGDGTFEFRVVAYQDNGDGTLSGGEVLPVCESEIDNNWVLTFNNRLEVDPAAHGPCGAGFVTSCVTEPETAIVRVLVGGVEVSECGTADNEDGALLEIEFIARDSAGYLGSFGIEAHYGNSHVNSLLALPSASLSMVSPAAGQHGPTYAAAIGQGAPQPRWFGGTMRLTVLASEAFPVPCCYELKLTAHSRDVVGCSSSLWTNVAEYSIGVGVCGPVEAVGKS